MEKAERKWEEEEEEGEEEAGVEGLRRNRLNRNHNTSYAEADTSNNKNNTVLMSNGNGDTNHHSKNGVIYSGSDDSSVEVAEEELKISGNGSLISGVNGGIEELGEEDGHKSSEKCVYYQNHEGLWKCRKCCWTYRSESVSSDDIQNSKRQLHMVTNFKTINQQESCFTCETEGTGSTNGLLLNGNSSAECSAEKNPIVHRLDVTIQNLDIGKCLSPESNLQYEKDLKNGSLSGSTLLPSEISLEEDDTSYKSSSYKAVESAAINLVSESDHEVTELDVEGVLKKQNTHDLYCPNCNSCITTRVILRKRKRNLRTSGEDVKRNKPEKIIGSELTSISAGATSDPAHSTVDISLDGNVSHASNDYDRERQPDVFRCLSCFSIFIPTGNGFKLFQMFGDKREKENMQDPQQIPVVKKSWFSSFFPSDKGELFMEQGTGSRADVETDNVEELIPSNLNKQNGEASSIHEAPSDAQTYFVGELVKSGITGSKEDGNNILPPSTKRPAEPGKPDNIEAHTSTNLNKQNGELVKSGITGSKEIRNNSKGGSSLEDSEATYNHLDSLNYSKEMLSNQESEHPETSSAGKTLINVGEAPESATFIPQQDGLKFLIPSDVSSFTVENSTTDQKVDVALQKIISGNDTIIVVEASQIEPAAARRVQGITVSAETGNLLHTETQIHVNEQRGTSTRGIQGLDIIKSIVYGGLVESITSLGVVSSAAGADTATFNVLALGLANLIGGLIVIVHNFWELKTNHTRWPSTQLSEQVDRYQELLGRRTDFVLHAIIAILSFLIFGLLPPVIYGFSFRQSDDRDLKLVAVAAASLLGIIILAIGKAYVKNPPKSYTKTVVDYAIMGLMVSGVSYAVGNMITKFLEKLGFSKSSLAVSLTETGSMKPAWASY